MNKETNHRTFSLEESGYSAFRSFGAPEKRMTDKEFSAGLRQESTQEAVSMKEFTIFNRRSKGQDRKLGQNGRVPFLDEPEPSQQKFVNLYGGPFAAQMQLNRNNAERLIKVAGIEGKIIMTDLPIDRRYSITGVNSDGSVTGRKGLFWGEKLEDERSPEALVKPIPEGWRIEIAGQEILDGLVRQRSQKPLDRRFIKRVNSCLRAAFSEIIIREKLTSEKNPHFISDLTLSVIHGSVPPLWLVIGGLNEYNIAWASILPFMTYAFINALREPSYRRKIDHPIEYFFPYVEIDRVIRGLAFANLKGRNLVRPKEKS